MNAQLSPNPANLTSGFLATPHKLFINGEFVDAKSGKTIDVIDGGMGMDFALPFGGSKQSGWGRENGREGVEAYTEIKSVSVAL